MVVAGGTPSSAPKTKAGTCCKCLVHDPFIKSVSAHGVGSWLAMHADVHVGSVGTVNGCAIDARQDGGVELDHLHCPGIHQSSTLKRTANGGVLFENEHITPPLGQDGGHPGPYGPSADDDDVSIHVQRWQPAVQEGGADGSFTFREPIAGLLGFVEPHHGRERVAFL